MSENIARSEVRKKVLENRHWQIHQQGIRSADEIVTGCTGEEPTTDMSVCYSCIHTSPTLYLVSPIVYRQNEWLSSSNNLKLHVQYLLLSKIIHLHISLTGSQYGYISINLVNQSYRKKWLLFRIHQ